MKKTTKKQLPKQDQRRFALEQLKQVIGAADIALGTGMSKNHYDW